MVVEQQQAAAELHAAPREGDEKVCGTGVTNSYFSKKSLELPPQRVFF